MWWTGLPMWEGQVHPLWEAQESRERTHPPQCWAGLCNLLGHHLRGGGRYLQSLRGHRMLLLTVWAPTPGQEEDTGPNGHKAQTQTQPEASSPKWDHLSGPRQENKGWPLPTPEFWGASLCGIIMARANKDLWFKKNIKIKDKLQTEKNTYDTYNRQKVDCLKLYRIHIS